MKQENAYKIKLVKILEILRQDSDEDNYIETSEILSKLAAMGIVCDRRTLATDIEVLNSYGYEVLSEKSQVSQIDIALLIVVLMCQSFAYLWMRAGVQIYYAKKDRSFN